MKVLELLQSPAERGASALCLSLLADAEKAHARFAAHPDADALHDVRVALRRLRTSLRAFDPLLDGGSGRKLRKQLGKLADLTSAVRDADVQLPWLEEHREHAAAAEKPAIDVLVEQLRARRQAGLEQLGAKFARRFERAAGRLRARLQGQRERHAQGPATLAVGLARLLEAQGTVLGRAMAAAKDIEVAHVARIEAKRLRYLLEPLRASERADAAEAVGRLRDLQDALGEVHDAAVLCDALEAALVQAAQAQAHRLHAALGADATGAALQRAREQDLEAGLLLVDAAAHARLRKALAGLRKAWPKRRVTALLAEVATVAAALRT